jgi:hypothetical protein
LHLLSELGEFFPTSDAVIPTFTRWPILKHLTEQIPEVENEAFRTLGYTIGGMMVFPGNQVNRRPTINAARGLHPQIRDRFDLTLECIRRRHRGVSSLADGAGPRPAGGLGSPEAARREVTDDPGCRDAVHALRRC